MAKAKTSTSIEIAPLDIREFDVSIENLPGSPLVMNCFNKKVQDKIKEKSQGAASTGKSIAPTEEEYHAAFYRNPDCADVNRYWLPAVVFKAALEAIANNSKGFPKTLIRETIFIENDFVEIKGKPEPFEYPVRVPAGGNAKINTRPRFKTWAAKLRISYNAKNLSADQVVTLLNMAGYGSGICEGRPQKTALNWGRFRVIGDKKK